MRSTVRQTKKKRQSKRIYKGVYKKPSSKYISVTWDKQQKCHYHGTYETPEEAQHARQMALCGHHWDKMPVDAPTDCFGFVYLITNKNTGKQYVGKKQFYLWSGPVGGHKCTAPLDPVWWDVKAWRKSDWMKYTGSCDELTVEMRKGNIFDYRFEVLAVCANKLELHLTEVMEQADRNVLEATDSNGEYLYYNKNIAGMEFRPPFKKEEAAKMIAADRDKIRNYYLKPNLCPKCKGILSYGSTKCNDC